MGTAELQALGWALCLPGSTRAWGQERCQLPPGIAHPGPSSPPTLQPQRSERGDTAVTKLGHLHPKQPPGVGGRGGTRTHPPAPEKVAALPASGLGHGRRGENFG